MKTKDEFLAELRKRERENLHTGMPIQRYLTGCVTLMFELCAETLADLKSENPK